MAEWNPPSDPQGDWGQAAVNNGDTGFGAGALNSPPWGMIHEHSYGHAITNLVGGGGGDETIVLDFNPVNTPSVIFVNISMIGDLYIKLKCPSFDNLFYALGRSTSSDGYVRMLSPTSIGIRWSAVEDTISLSQDITNKEIRIERVGAVSSVYLADGMVLIGTGTAETGTFRINALGIRSATGFYQQGQISLVDLNGQWIADFIGSGTVLPDTVTGNDGVITGATWETI